MIKHNIGDALCVNESKNTFDDAEKASENYNHFKNDTEEHAQRDDAQIRLRMCFIKELLAA